MRDWTPRRLGKIYCSPLCGAGCTLAAFDRANVEANALAARMGNGWTPTVSENLGWHYSVRRGVVEIHPRCRGGSISGKWTVEGYTAMFNSARQIIAHANTAQDALGFVLQDARTLERRIAADCAALLDQ